MSFVPSAQDADANGSPAVPGLPAAELSIVPAEAPVSPPTMLEEDFRLFAARNGNAFLKTAPPGQNRKIVGRGFCVPGFLWPLPWFLYRKMYTPAAALTLAPVVLSLMHFPSGVLDATAFAVSILGALGKRLYVAKAVRMIGEIRAAAPDDTSARAEIMRAGGVSPAGAVVGVALVGAFIVIAILRR